MSQIELIKRHSMGLGEHQPAFDKIADFLGPGVRQNPKILLDYGRNIYENGEKIGYALDVRITGYRGLPINQIQQLAFEVDGQWIPDECKELWYEGKRYPMSDIGMDKFDNNWMWKYTDALRIFFAIPGGIEQGVHHVIFGEALRDHYSTVAVCEKDVTIV